MEQPLIDTLAGSTVTNPLLGIADAFLCHLERGDRAVALLVEAGTWQLRGADGALLTERRWDDGQRADPAPVTALEGATVSAVTVTADGQLRLELSSGATLTVDGEVDPDLAPRHPWALHPVDDQAPRPCGAAPDGETVIGAGGRTLVIVIENPDADPSVHIVGDAEVINVSAYPASGYNSEPGDYTEYPDEMRALARRCTGAGNEAAAAELNSLAATYERRWGAKT